MGAGGRGRWRVQEKAIKEQANQYSQKPARFKSLSTTAVPRQRGEEAGGLGGPFSGKEHLLRQAAEPGGRVAGASQPAGWAEVVGQLPLGDLGTPGSPWEPIRGSSHSSAGRDLGDLLRVLPSHFTDGDPETQREKHSPEVTWLEGSKPLPPGTGDFPTQDRLA